MAAKIEVCEDRLIIFLSGEIDHHSAALIRAEADARITQMHPKEVELNFKDVSFMDSSGIGLIMGRYRLASSFGGRVCISNVSAYLRRVMRLAGIDSIIEIKDLEEEHK